MNHYIKPEMKITYFGGSEILTSSGTTVLPPEPNYAANNMSKHMVGTTVKAIQTRTVDIHAILSFK